MTFDTHFRTMMGIKPVQAVKALYDIGVRVLGANCGNGPGEIERVIGKMATVKPADVFLIAHPTRGCRSTRLRPSKSTMTARRR